jgi:hypothetical protein
MVMSSPSSPAATAVKTRSLWVPVSAVVSDEAVPASVAGEKL